MIYVRTEKWHKSVWLRGIQRHKSDTDAHKHIGRFSVGKQGWVESDWQVSCAHPDDHKSIQSERHLQGCFTWWRACEIWESFWAFLFSGGSVTGLGYWFYARSFSLMYGFTIPLEIKLYEKTNTEKSEWKEIIWFRGLFLHLHIQTSNFPGQEVVVLWLSPPIVTLSWKRLISFLGNHIFTFPWGTVKASWYSESCESFQNTHTAVKWSPSALHTLPHSFTHWFVLQNHMWGCVCHTQTQACTEAHTQTRTQLQGFLRDALECARKVCTNFSGKTRLKPFWFKLSSSASSSPSPLHVPSVCLSPTRRVIVSPLQPSFSPSGKTEYCHHFPGGASCQKAIITAEPHHNTHKHTHRREKMLMHAVMHICAPLHIYKLISSVFNERWKLKDTHTLPLSLLWLPPHLPSAQDKELFSQQIQQRHISYFMLTVCVYTEVLPVAWYNVM